MKLLGKVKEDLTGRKFGRWLVIEYVGKSRWKCKCECGTEREVASKHLKDGTSTSCGCAKNKIVAGAKFGRLTVIGLGTPTKTEAKKVKCQCECGNIVEVKSGNLSNGHTKSCGCYNKERVHETLFKNLAGQRFGRLLVTEEYKIENKQTSWLCKCDCGNSKYVLACDLNNGSTSSCGCYQREQLLKAVTTCNGMYGTRIHKIYTNMIRRCYDNTLDYYYNYGGRGIRVCDRWRESFNNFYEDMGKSYEEHVKEFGEKGTSIDRIDVNGNYELANVRWATWEEQQNNRRNNHYIVYKGKTHTISEWSSILNINYSKLYNRLYKNNFNLSLALGELHSDKEQKRESLLQ